MNRWKILTDHVEIFTLKKLSETRWEAKVNSVKAVRYQISGVHDALVTLSEEECRDHEIAHEAITLAEQLKDFSFLVSLIVWYDVLFHINIVSKSLQAKDMDIAVCTEMLGKCCSFLERYRKTGFKEAITTAKGLAEELEVEPIFKQAQRIRRVKCRYDEYALDEPVSCPEKKFEVEFFNTLLDTAITSMKERFAQFDDFSQTWRFLYNLQELPDKEELRRLCNNLQNKLSDIDGNLLVDELISIKAFLSNNMKKITPIDTLNFVKKHNLQELYPNIWISLRILLTIPVTVASGERSFSKLKLIKTYLRSNMSQDRLEIGRAHV